MNPENKADESVAQSNNKSCGAVAMFFIAITAGIVVVLYLLKTVLLPQ